jgi:CubicO group peptidase (beta-lactamase class C family)
MQVSESLLMRICLVFCLAFWGIVLHGIPAFSADAPRKGLVQTDPEEVGLLSSRLKFIDDAVGAAIEAGEVPGAVVLVARHGRIAYLKAFGDRSIKPEQEPMTVDTIFDMSSLTKVMATAPSIMLLVENGVLRIEDKVKRYLPNFSGGGKDSITLRQLLTHYSGLPADFNLSRQWSGYRAALEELWKTKTDSEPGKEFEYSDINFIALGEIVRAVSGKTLDVYAQENIFVPLEMTDTFFHPPAKLIKRIAPTESRRNIVGYMKGQASLSSSDKILRGEVHDPTAWRMGGVAGHAGLFSTAQDLAIFAQMFLDHGAYKRGRFLSPRTVEAMISPQSPANSPQVRGYGWDLDSIYSAPRGDIFSGGYGHTGYTGTSLWIHPPTDVFVIILSNRVHPDGGKDINHLRAVVVNIVAAAISDSR